MKTGIFGGGILLCAAALLGCDVTSAERPQDSKPAATPPKTLPSGDAPPSFKVAISQVNPSWRDAQQTFTLRLTNNGEKAETIHALVYARNEAITPPRRALSPPTATAWFELAESQDGKLTARDIEKHWKANNALTARGNKLKSTWDVLVPAGATKSVEASHLLDETSPYPAVKGKKLTKQAFTEYQVWLFTADGHWFFSETLPATGEKVGDKPATKPEPAKPAGNDANAEEEATKTLNLARYYIDNKKPDRAKEKLQLILDKYPQTDAAKAAKKLMMEMTAR